MIFYIINILYFKFFIQFDFNEELLNLVYYQYGSINLYDVIFYILVSLILQR